LHGSFRQARIFFGTGQGKSIGVSTQSRNVPILAKVGMSPFHVVGTVRFGVAVARISAPREWAE
jgi:hypothetical protein